MIVFLQINYVKKEGNFVTEITGMVRAQSSDEKPKQQTLKAIDQPWDVHWRHPKFGDKLIKQGTVIDPHTKKETKYFLVVDPNNPSHNLLEDLSEY